MDERIKGLVRPLVTVLMAAALVYFIAAKIDVPDYFKIVATGTITFWFAQRNGISPNGG